MALIYFFLIFVLYAAKKGIKAIALTASILFLIAMVTGHSVSLMDVPEKEWDNIFPLFEFGMKPMVLGIVVLCSIWAELLYLLFLPLEDVRAKGLFAVWSLGVTFNCFTMLSTMTGTLMIFGMGMSDNFNYPALEIVRILSLKFIDRFDIYGMVLMITGCYIRCSLYMRLGYNGLSSFFNGKWMKRIVAGLIIAAVCGSALYMAQNHMRIGQFGIYYAHGVFLLPLPILLWLLTKRNLSIAEAVKVG